jgi:hypothetical protein
MAIDDKSVKVAKVAKVSVKAQKHKPPVTVRTIIFSQSVNPDKTKIIKSSSIKSITEKIGNSIFVDHKEWRITWTYTDGSKEIAVVPKESPVLRRIIFTRSKPKSGYIPGYIPGYTTTHYFSDGTIENFVRWRR